MSFVTVKENNVEKLHFVREPGLRSWSILGAMVALGFGAALYSADSLLWQVCYIGACTFVGLSQLEEWEDCIFDCTKDEVNIKRVTIFQKILNPFGEMKSVVCNLSEISDVRILEEDVRFAGRGYQVVLVFSPGYSIGVTEAFTFGQKSEYEQVAEKIKHFVNLDTNVKESIEEEDGQDADIESSSSSSSTADDYDFEKVESSEIQGGI